VKPIGGRVLVKVLEDEGNQIWTPDGIARTRRAVALEIGDDVRYVERGDEILFMLDAGGVIQFRHEDEQLVVMPEAAVLLVLDRVTV
jgi:co-chaperonin GroES (HSP10)